MWNLSFISEDDFTKHVKATIEKYGEKLESFDLKRFNKNLIDPVKLIFDKTVQAGSKSSTVRYSVNVISQITTILGTFIRGFSTISKSVTFPITVTRAVGTLYLKIRMA